MPGLIGKVFGVDATPATWQDQFAKQTGRRPEELGIKTPEQARDYVVKKAGERVDQGEVFQGPGFVGDKPGMTGVRG